MSVEIRRYTEDGERQKFDTSKFAGLSYTCEKFGGYTDGVMSTVGEDVDDVDAEIGDRFELWDGGRRYRAYVNEVNPSEDEPGQMEVVLYGRMIDLTRIVLESRFIYPSPVDVSVVVADVMAEVQAEHTDIVTEIAVVGITIEEYDARGKTAEECIQDLLSFAEATACFGFDVDDYGADRFYVRVVDLDAQPDHVVALQGPTVLSRKRRRSASDRFTVAVIEGGTPKYPQKLPNGSFEVLRANGDGLGNLVRNGGFEEEGDDPGEAAFWALEDGASTKAAVEGTTPRTGSRAAEMDVIDGGGIFDPPSEYIYQETLSPPIALKENTDYLFSFYATPESNFNTSDPPVMKYTVYWLDDSGDVIVSDQGFAVCDQRYWKYFDLTSRSPLFSTGLAGFSARFEPESGNWGEDNKGVWIDDVTLADATVLYAVGWGIETEGTGQVTQINWAMRPGYHGRSHLAIYVAGCVDETGDDDDGDNNVKILPVPEFGIDVLGGEVYTFSGRYRSYNPDEVPAKCQFEIHYKDAEGNDAGSHISTLSPGAPVTDWEYTETFDEVPNDAVKAYVQIRIVENGGIRFDALSFRNRADTSDVYLPEGNVHLRFKSHEVVTEEEDYDVHHAYETYGRFDRVISEGLVTTVAQAMQLAKVELLAAKFMPEPELTFSDDPRFFNTWQSARFIGRGAPNWQNGNAHIVRVNTEISDDARVDNVQFVRIKQTTEDVLRRLIDEAGRDRQDAGIGASGAGTSAGGGSGGGTGPAGPPGPPGADGAGALDYMWVPLTNGDPDDPLDVYDALGEHVMVLEAV